VGDSNNSVSAAPEVSSRLRGVNRFADLLPSLSRLLGWSDVQVRWLLPRLDTEQDWVPGPSAGIKLLPLPHASGDTCCVLRMEPGAVFPHHPHELPEALLVLQGGLRNDDGTELWRGEQALHPVGSSHSVTALRGPPCLALVRLRGEGAG